MSAWLIGTMLKFCERWCKGSLVIRFPLWSPSSLKVAENDQREIDLDRYSRSDLTSLPIPVHPGGSGVFVVMSIPRTYHLQGGRAAHLQNMTFPRLGRPIGRQRKVWQLIATPSVAVRRSPWSSRLHLVLLLKLKGHVYPSSSSVDETRCLFVVGGYKGLCGTSWSCGSHLLGACGQARTTCTGSSVCGLWPSRSEDSPRYSCGLLCQYRAEAFIQTKFRHKRHQCRTITVRRYRRYCCWGILWAYLYFVFLSSEYKSRSLFP